ncbi:MAG: IS110 family transposase [Caldilineaceae bacterium]|nr:IS110 family transposase [Caldilineaceae bacterium]
MSNKLILGVDMAKKDFAAAIWVDDVAEELGAFANDASGRQSLYEQVKVLCEQQDVRQIHLIIEATGGYEAGLVAYAYEQGWLVSMPNPKQVRDWAKGVGYRAKTDRVDARILAHYGQERNPPLRPPLAGEVSELDSLLKRRLDLEQALHKERNRLTEAAYRPGLSSKVQESFQQVIEALEEALAEIERAIQDLQQSYEPFQQNVSRLLDLPGVGPKVVLPLLVKLFQWQNLTSGQGDAKGLTAFIGLDPQLYESGRSVRKRPGISKMGDSEMRRLLYMAALGGVGGKNALKQFYDRLVGRGKAKKVALVAAARKILTWAWTIFSRQIEWDPAFHAN